jgi:Fanconi anemia group M protein
VVVEYTTDKVDSAANVVSLYDYFATSEHDSLAVNFKPKLVSLKPPTVGEQILMGIPTVGIENARSVLGEFKTILGVSMASEKELMKIDGVGKVKARLIKEALNESYN